MPTLTSLRKLFPLLLIILISWQSVAAAHHKGEHQHIGKVDHHCALCTLGMSAAAEDAEPAPACLFVLAPAECPLFSPHPAEPVVSKARSPPRLVFSSL